MFFQLVFSAWVVTTAYVSWRGSSVPAVSQRIPRWLFLLIVVLLGLMYPLAFSVRRAGWVLLADTIELVSVTWLGTQFLLFVTLLVADVVTGFGLIFRRAAPRVRGWALVAGALLAFIALVQGFRAPVVREYEVHLHGLAPERDGTTLVFISDLHLGTLLGRSWLEARIAQIAALHPDAIIVGGDVLEGDDDSERDLVPVFGRLSAPLGVWAVAGNHEHHGGGVTVQALEAEGVRMLRNQWRELAAGLIVAGVEDGRFGRRGAGREDGGRGQSEATASAIDAALAGRPRGEPTILVSHAPEQVERAARAGVGLMLSAHTHDGQIWPFRYIVRLRFPYLAGRYDVDGMPLLVCRGTGTFGPRMRLWHRSEILRITLRRATG